MKSAPPQERLCVSMFRLLAEFLLWLGKVRGRLTCGKFWARYFEQYQQAVQAETISRAGRKPLRIEQPGFVVRAGGHLRSYAGHAYIPEMLPQGVNAEEIR